MKHYSNFNNMLFFFCYLFFSFSFFACKKPPAEIEYTMSHTSINFDAKGGEYEFTVSVKFPATIESIKASDPWCQVSMYGVSPAIVVVKVAPNNTNEARNTSVTVNMELDDTKISATVKITQEGAENEKGVLINGVRWATRNVDAPGTFAANPEDPGMFYQWNRKVGWSATDPMISSNGGTTWDTYYSEGDTWEKANDPCPQGWRVPTHEELISLAKADGQWTNLNGMNGRIFGSDSDLLFLPAAGRRMNPDGARDELGRFGNYWSSVPSTNFPFAAMSVHFSGSGAYVGGPVVSRSNGFSLRCVAE